MAGGARPGAGRKKGVPNTKTRERIAAAESSGMMPHEFLLSITRGETQLDGYVPTFADRLDAAKAAVNYYAPKLSSIEHTNGDDGPFQIVIASGDAEL
jgi:hypothetical protein